MAGELWARLLGEAWAAPGGGEPGTADSGRGGLADHPRQRRGAGEPGRPGLRQRPVKGHLTEPAGAIRVFHGAPTLASARRPANRISGWRRTGPGGKRGWTTAPSALR